MRKWTETVHNWPPIKQDYFYKLKVTSIQKSRKTIRLQLEFLDRQMAGRTLTVSLPLPVRPAGVTADFFCACGMPVTIGSEILPRSTINCVIRACFVRADEGYQLGSIKPVRKEYKNA